MPIAYVKNVLNDLTLINMTVARFMGSFLIRYDNGHTK